MTKESRLVRVLRLLEFQEEFDTVAGGVRCRQFIKQIDERRRVNVQIWYDDHNLRVSHEFRGCSDTEPSYFTDVMTMAMAIAFESTRTDSSYAINGSTAGDKLSA